MRTNLSNGEWFVVHFFDARQRNEPKKTRIRDWPSLMYPSAAGRHYSGGRQVRGRQSSVDGMLPGSFCEAAVPWC